jgi:sugar lactone lactonase YvrE
VSASPDPSAPSRYERAAAISPAGAGGYELETIRPPSALYGANGIRVGPDGRLWICEALFGRVSTCDTRTGELATAIPMDGSLLGPDDLAFDASGTAYITDGPRISARRPDGTIFTLVDGLEHPNGITVDADGRLYVDEFRMGGRLLEIDVDSGAVRVIAEGLDLPNACEKGPDGRIYLQNVLAGTISAVDVDSGEVELVAEGLRRVSAVKFDPRGRLVASQADAGEVTAIDLATGSRETIARMPHRTIDNIAFDADGTLFVSNYSTGCVLRVAPGGDPDGEILVPPGLVNPSSLAPIDDRTLLVGNFVTVVAVHLDGTFEEWSPWSPVSAETVVAAAWPIDALSAHVLTGGGQLYLCRVGQSIADVTGGLEAAASGERPETQLTDGGATAITGSPAGLLIAFEGGDIRRLEADGAMPVVARTGLSRIAGLAAAGGAIAAADADAGTVAVLRNGDGATTLGGFGRPTGVALTAAGLFVVDQARREVVRCDPAGGEREVVAVDLPLGSPMPGRPARGVASLLARADGSILIGCDGDGSIRRLAHR